MTGSALDWILIVQQTQCNIDVALLLLFRWRLFLSMMFSIFKICYSVRSPGIIVICLLMSHAINSNFVIY